MNKIACIYFEGNDSKVALFSKENDKLILLKAESQDTSLVFAEKQSGAESKSGGNGKSKETVSYDFIAEETSGFNRNYLQKLNDHAKESSDFLFNLLNQTEGEENTEPTGSYQLAKDS